MDIFPIWNPQYYTRRNFKSHDYKVRLKALRNSSSGFISKKDVRNIIFKKDNFKCVICGKNSNLTIDHIVSVYRAAKKEFPVETLRGSKAKSKACKKSSRASSKIRQESLWNDNWLWGTTGLCYI